MPPLAAQLRQAHALHEKGDTNAAEAAYRAVLARAPGQPDANLLLAELLFRAARQPEALPLAEAATRARPDDPGAWNLLGSVQQELNRPDEALASFDRALRLHPTDAAALRNRANTLLDEARPLDALAGYDAALRAEPDHPGTLLNRGLALRALGRVREAAASLARAWALEPAADAGWNLALCRLMLGEWDAGWRGLDLRAQLPDAAPPPPPDPTTPPWRGEPLAGRTLLLRHEGGFGDAVQFSRLAPLAAARGGPMLLEAPPELLPLLAPPPPVTVVPAGAPPPPAALWAPLLSLPNLLRLRPDAVPPPTPLRVPPQAAARWRDRLGPATTRRVGICWRGTPGHRDRRADAIPLPLFARLFDAPAEFVVLQTTLDAPERAALSPHPRVRLPDGVDHADFTDTAALTALMDLVVTADSTVAHLAGTLGVPTLLLLPLAPDWRWMTERPDTPWYPTLHLLRQETPGAWEPVLDRAAELLRGDGKQAVLF